MKQARRIMTMALGLGLAVAVYCAPAGAKASQHKANFDQYKNIVGVSYVKAVVDGKTKGLIVDSRPLRGKYLKGHIPGSISLPTSQFAKLAAARLPKDKNSLVVFYCGGFKCPLSHKGAFMAEKMGYKKIAVFAAGYPAWKKAYGIGQTGPYAPPQKFAQYPLMVGPAFVKKIVDAKVLGMIYDARPKIKKYDKGHIPGAVNMPTSQFKKMSGILPRDKNVLIIFYCGGFACPLSHKNAFWAKKLGYKNIRVFAAGYPAWKKAYGAGAAGLKPTVAKKPAAKKMFKAGKEDGSIDLNVFRKLVKSKPKSVLIIDVRDAKEYQAGHFPGAVNMSVNQLEKKLPGWKVKKPMIFVCATGARSGEAFYMVKDKRPDINEVYYLDGELSFGKGGSFKIKPPK